MSQPLPQTIYEEGFAQGLVLQIPALAMESMKTHAESTFPNECCGFFFGTDEGSKVVTHVQEVRNAQEGDQRRRFLIDPLDYMKAEKWAMENELVLLGIYHSHPNHPARPSIHDLRQAAPYFSYIILSIQEGNFDHVCSWRLGEEDHFLEEEIIID
ncbi:MAG: M67 family metallopeptidase [Bacteroidota bacterium]